MAELDLERVAALSKEPPRVLNPGMAPADAARAVRMAVDLLAVMPDPEKPVRKPTGEEDGASSP
ncbi:hypothetical protein J7E88_34875 [Streptomyces sp. ISL-10]|uniref:hypothetical protein n=1 Tax=Streptomyces sp. ISL-10 TaxID=2819172 RepID=UPI001BEAEA87|nr:hypothetical protein [Streptomyces sp. ISL-10]MBT2370318.1 hypothetical protein [Streptomyces sp. ISL-10]